jgi:hypothetical protein
MKALLPAIATVIVSAFCTVSASAATVTEFPVPQSVGVPYHWTVALGGVDTAIFSRHVGAWSWEDENLFNAGLGQPPVGWTHESDWVAVSLTAPATFTVRIERDANVPEPVSGNPNHLASVASMFPSFTLWSQVDNDTTQFHTYNNRGNVSWAEDIVYLGHVDNSTQTSVEQTWVLPAGDYTIALGSNSPATDPDRQGYRTTLTSTPVPEPGVLSLLVVGASLSALRRRSGTRSEVSSRNP